MEHDSGASAGALTEEAAANLIASSLLGADHREEEKPEPHTAEPEVSREETEQAAEGEGADPANSEPEEPQYYDFDKFDPEMPVRLRDGSTTRFGDIKRSWAELQELPKHRQELETRAAQVQSDMQKAAQQAQFFQQVLPQALRVLQENLGQPPQPPQRTGDPITDFEKWAEYTESKNGYDARVQRFGEFQQAQHHQALQAQHEEQQRQQALITEQSQKLREVIRDDAQLEQLGRDLLKIAPEAWGFSKDEIERTFDHRVFLMAKDAIAYRKLQAEKPKVMEKAKTAAPVQQPGKRVSEAERADQRYQEERARLRKSGRADDAVALLAKQLS